MSKPVKTSVEYVLVGEPVSPEVPNRPIKNLETNIDDIISYLTNDGAGSTMDSDFLDGEHGAFYLDFSNFTGGLLNSQFSDNAHGNRAGGNLHSLVTQVTAGFMSANDKKKLDGIANAANNYVLPKASTTTLGGIKVGGGLVIDANGFLSANVQEEYGLPIATSTTLGGIKVGDGLGIDSSTGVLTANVKTQYVLPTASSTTLGGIKVGGGLSITSGVLEANVKTQYSLPTASSTVLGGVKVGSRLTISSGQVSADVQTDENFTSALLTKLNGIETNANNYALPTASSTVLGGVKVGSYLTITSGVMSVNTGNLAKLNVANTFSQTQNAPAWNSTSDRDLKENIVEVDPINFDFSNLGLYEFDYKDSNIHSIGTMADEASFVNEFVAQYDSNGKPIGVDYGRLALLGVMHIMRRMDWV